MVHSAREDARMTTLTEDQVRKVILAVTNARAMATTAAARAGGGSEDTIGRSARIGIRMLLIELADTFKNDELLDYANSEEVRS